MDKAYYDASRSNDILLSTNDYSFHHLLYPEVMPSPNDDICVAKDPFSTNGQILYILFSGFASFYKCAQVIKFGRKVIYGDGPQ